MPGRFWRPWRGERIADCFDADVNGLLVFYQAGRKNGDFDAGVRHALRLVLASPLFLFRAEPDPPNATPGMVYRVGDLEMASRLAFFLWSSIPDDELVNVAAQGKLKDPAVLAGQVRRMLADARSEALVRNFAAQWLFLRNLKSHLPDGQEFPNFDDNLREAFRRETELLFESVIREDRSVLDLLTADYTFVNERSRDTTEFPSVRHSNSARQAHRRESLGAARARQHPHRDVVSEQNVSRPARQVDSGNILGTPPRRRSRTCPRSKKTADSW